ncbi:hypothetical protein [Teichococcus aestuarii]|uniref:Uncharacterized protein n=1 Tax=Teichococcus aestuarii TaxID=568898 RepID=A0A2U1UXK0_9PROT|nr:hypothetical protein [Pseudoroseomonas aestuarii]PWC26393.1 hypothetical protein CR165_23450 [Pseudoroseomonas aestuarii]
MTVGQYSDELARVNRAIAAVQERGQRVEIGDRVIWRGDLEALRAERKRLEPPARRPAPVAAIEEAALVGPPDGDTE